MTAQITHTITDREVIELLTSYTSVYIKAVEPFRTPVKTRAVVILTRGRY